MAEKCINPFKVLHYVLSPAEVDESESDEDFGGDLLLQQMELHRQEQEAILAEQRKQQMEANSKSD